MKRTVKNLILLKPIRSIADLPTRERARLLNQMQRYVGNCEFEDVRLRTFKEKVNR
jgi:predicted sugar kinase